MKLTKDDAKSGLNGHQRPLLHQHHCQLQLQLRPFNCRISNCSKWALTNIRSLCNKQDDFALSLLWKVQNWDDGSPWIMCSRVDTKQLYLDSVTFSPETVCSTLKKLKPTTSLGPDNIPNVFLEKCANALSVPLAHIFDTSFKDNTLPCCWNTANVQPIFNKKPS